MIKLIAIDIDGTLLNSRHEITPAVKDAIQSAKKEGIKVVLCTGRPLKGVQSFLKELGLDESDQYVITYNGALIQKADGSQTIKEFTLSTQDALKIKGVADKQHTFYHMVDQEYMYTTNQPLGKYTQYESDLVNMTIKQVDEAEFAQSRVYLKAMIVDEELALNRVIEQLPVDFKERFYYVKSSPFYLEILHKQANKGNALLALAEYLTIDKNQTMAVGDNANDIDMLKVAGIGVAMENASDEVKLYADFVTKSNDHDGVAYMINHYIKG